MRKTVAEFAGKDLPGELVHGFRIESSVLCRSVMAPPWGFGVAGRDAGSFHLVLSGKGWLEVDGIDGALRLRSGDLVLLPRGHAHWAKDAPGSAAPPLTSILSKRTVVDGELHFGGEGGPLTEIVCGVFRLVGGSTGIVLRVLPPVIHRRAEQAAGWWAPVFTAVRDEASVPTPGGSAVVNRLLETLLADAMRTTIAEVDAGATGAQAFLDPRLGPVLARLREQPDAAWTVTSMARLAQMSRSTFSDAFRTRVGVPPMRYLADLRLTRAVDLLRTTEATVSDIARQVGYASESSFSRAFRARYGDSPSRYRRGSQRK